MSGGVRQKWTKHLNVELIQISNLNSTKRTEGHLHRRLFGQMLRRIWALPTASG